VQLGGKLERAVSVARLVDVVAPSLEGSAKSSRSTAVVDDENSCFWLAMSVAGRGFLLARMGEREREPGGPCPFDVDRGLDPAPWDRRRTA
jgi:hypothetical protein